MTKSNRKIGVGHSSPNVLLWNDLSGKFEDAVVNVHNLAAAFSLVSLVIKQICQSNLESNLMPAILLVLPPESVSSSNRIWWIYCTGYSICWTPHREETLVKWSHSETDCLTGRNPSFLISGRYIVIPTRAGEEKFVPADGSCCSTYFSTKRQKWNLTGGIFINKTLL